MLNENKQKNKERAVVVQDFNNKRPSKYFDEWYVPSDLSMLL